MDPIYYDFTIDFDKASELWRSNKKHIGCGHSNMFAVHYVRTVSIAKKKQNVVSNATFIKKQIKSP